MEKSSPTTSKEGVGKKHGGGTTSGSGSPAEGRGSKDGKGSPQNEGDVKKSSILPRGLAHRVKQEIAAYIAPPLFKYYLPIEIQQLLDLFTYMLSTYGVGEKVGAKMRDTIIRALVELFVMFDDGITQTSTFTDVYQLFRRVCSLIRNTYFLKQTGEAKEFQDENPIEEKEEVEKETPKHQKGRIPAHAITRLSQLVKELNIQLVANIEPLKMTKVTMTEIQDIFDVIVKEEWIRTCFEDEHLGKIVCLLADFLQNY
eukprot:TRINITY_DN11207_c0_g1_i1.p1 TRINITY_DN11207_c0_g1~~TRINITY_DN11207_c0_g1_i1.p1  ORF type:complete len:257 (-),score=57.61 TRINITY_DN11207_c0_g1_i1:82-852(-)